MKVLDNLRYTKNHEWVLLEDDLAIVGVTDYAQSELGDIVYVEVDLLGHVLGVGDVFGSVEAVKTVSDLFMPIAGKVVSLNQKLENNPELVNEDPYGNGWIIKVQLNSNLSINDQLLSSAEYKELIGL
tara:strand:+ start:7736 stop:8119 length:384 start_codon:yes stop_codon:yes gene_type:complete